MKIGKYVKSMVYGGLDGVITTFAVVSGVVGAKLTVKVIIILGFSNLLADGFSMAVGDYLSTKSEEEYQKKLKNKEKENLSGSQARTYLGQKLNLIDLKKEDQYMILDMLANYDVEDRQKFLQLSNLNAEENVPLHNALVTFLSFFIFGLVPLLAFILGQFIEPLREHSLSLSILLTAVVLFILGALKSKVTAVNGIRSGFEMLAVGGLAALVAFAVGMLLGNI